MSIFRQTASSITAYNPDTIGIYQELIQGEIPLPGGNDISFINKGYSSNISIGSGADISSANFTITGVYNNKQIIETLKGPNNNFVYSDNLFEIVTSITSDSNINQGYGIGSNSEIAVVLNSYDTQDITNFNMNFYKILINSLSASSDWVAGDFIIYGVSGSMPSNLSKLKLDYNTRSSNLVAINDITIDITAAELNKGFIVSSDYPFTGIIVYCRNKVIRTPVFIEITQS